jgi:hypothetical protein
LASDLAVGFILGIVVMGLLVPSRGILFIILEQRKQIASLMSRVPAENGESGETFDKQDFPNRKENS